MDNNRKLVRAIRRVIGPMIENDINIRMRRCQDVPKFLKKLDAIQKRSAKSTLQLD